MTDAERHVFLSYVREDRDLVDRLQEALEAAGIPVWKDTKDLWPGEDWRFKIRQAIEQGALAFVACFSTNSVGRETTYQNEELILAAEQMRLRPQAAVWLIPARFDDCELPHLDLGAGRTLTSLNWVDLFERNWDTGLAKLLVSVFRILGLSATSVTVPLSASLKTIVDRVKSDVTGGGRAVATHDALRQEISNLRSHPLLQANPHAGSDDQAEVLSAFELDVVNLVGIVSTVAYWGDARMDRWWLDDLTRMAARPHMSGSVDVLDRPRLPGVALAWSAGVAAVAAGRSDLLTSMLGLGAVPDGGGGRQIPAVMALGDDLLHTSDSLGRLYRLLRPTFVDHLGIGPEAFADAWDRWLFLRAVAAKCLRSQGLFIHVEWGGLLVNGLDSTLPTAQGWLCSELARDQELHPLIASGIWQGSRAELLELVTALSEDIGQFADDQDWRLLPPNSAGALPSGRHYPGSFTDNADKYFRWEERDA